MTSTFSLCTNACATDDARIAHVIPSWLRTFKGRLTELVVVVDRTPPTGRIAKLHRHGNLEKLDAVLAELQQAHSLLRVVNLPDRQKIKPMLRKWFRGGQPIRCHDGSPIAAMAYTIDQARGPLVMRTDCDMIFHDDGFIDKANRLLQSEFGLVEPPRVGPIEDEGLSSRALLLNKQRFESIALPLRVQRIDFLRRIHRRLHGRPTFLAFEQILRAAVENHKFKFCRLDAALGYSCHIGLRDQFLRPDIQSVISDLEIGHPPERQRQASWDFAPQAWDSPDPSYIH